MLVKIFVEILLR